MTGIQSMTARASNLLCYRNIKKGQSFKTIQNGRTKSLKSKKAKRNYNIMSGTKRDYPKFPHAEVKGKQKKSPELSLVTWIVTRQNLSLKVDSKVR